MAAFIAEALVGTNRIMFWCDAKLQGQIVWETLVMNPTKSCAAETSDRGRVTSGKLCVGRPFFGGVSGWKLVIVTT